MTRGCCCNPGTELSFGSEATYSTHQIARINASSLTSSTFVWIEDWYSYVDPPRGIAIDNEIDALYVVGDNERLVSPPLGSTANAAKMTSAGLTNWKTELISPIDFIGAVVSPNSGPKDLFVIGGSPVDIYKFDSNGNVLASGGYDGYAGIRDHRIRRLSDDTILVASTSGGGGTTDAWRIFDTDLNLITSAGPTTSHVDGGGSWTVNNILDYSPGPNGEFACVGGVRVGLAPTDSILTVETYTSAGVNWVSNILQETGDVVNAVITYSEDYNHIYIKSTQPSSGTWLRKL